MTPRLADEDKARGRDAALVARRIRATIKRDVKLGRMAGGDVVWLATADSIEGRAAARMTIGDLLLSLPGVGPARATAALTAADVSGQRRISALGPHQLEKLRDLLQSHLLKLGCQNDHMRSGALVVVCGPSGVGKGTVIAEMVAQHSDIWLSVSTTTRKPRPGEVNGRDYFFVSADQFQLDIQSHGFLEWAQYADNYYGTLRQPVLERLESGQSVILEIDVAGARQIRESYPQALQVFLAPPSTQHLEDRLTARGTETGEVIAQRLAQAEHELAARDEFDHVIVNSTVKQATDDLLQLVYDITEGGSSL